MRTSRLWIGLAVFGMLVVECEGNPEGPGGPDDAPGTIESALWLWPGTWKVGGKVVGLEILRMEEGHTAGWTVWLDNPFLYNTPSVITPDGSPTGQPCLGAESPKAPIRVHYPHGATHHELAHATLTALYDAVLGSQASFFGTPVMGGCPTGDQLFWWEYPGEYEAFSTAMADDCGGPEQWEACEKAKCEMEANQRREWARRQVQLALAHDAQRKVSIAKFLVYAELLRPSLTADWIPEYQLMVDHQRKEYRGILGQPGLIEGTMANVETRRLNCLARVAQSHWTVQPGQMKPNCNFSFGYGPLGLSYNKDGTWTIAGGEGIIVSVTFNPQTHQMSVGVGAGLQGHFGPYHLDGSAGVEISLSDLDMEPFADISIGTGPLSCSLSNP